MRIYNADIEIDVEDISIFSFIEERGHDEVAGILRDEFDYVVIPSNETFQTLDESTPVEIWNYLLKEHSKWVLSKGHGLDVIRKDIEVPAQDKEGMWLDLCNNYPNFLAEKIGQLVIGVKNGNTEPS